MSNTETRYTFDPNSLPETPTPVYDVDGIQIGTFNPHTLIIHPTGGTTYGPMKLLGRMVFNMSGTMVGKIATDGRFYPR